MITTKQILKAVGHSKLKLWRVDAGYFFFQYDDLNANEIYETKTIEVYRLNHLPFERWVQEGQDFVAEVAAKHQLTNLRSIPMSTRDDYTPVGTKINGAYENDRNAENADLYKAIIREACEVTDVIVAHHIVFVKPEKRVRHVDGMPPIEFEFQLIQEVPSADTLIFDHTVAEKLWPTCWRDCLVKLALEPTETRDKLLAELYHGRPLAFDKGETLSN